MQESVAIAPASSLTLEALTRAFNLAFTGYYLPMRQTPESLATMMRENDVRAEVSQTLLLNGEAVGVGLVGMRDDRAWIGGMGVAPQWRGQGYGRILLEGLLDAMRAAGAQVAQLEVLTINIPALSLYSRAGFDDWRELRVYQGACSRSDSDEVRAAGDAGARIAPIPPAAAFAALASPRAVAPAWQRERRSIEQRRELVSGVGLWRGAELRAYLLYSRSQGGVVIFDAESRADGVELQKRDLVALARHVVDEPDTLVRAINSPADDPLSAALDALGCPVVARQREMKRPL